MKKTTLLAVVCAAAVLSTCSAMNGIGQMMVDAGELMVDAGNGNAQTMTPAKVLTAETDLTRQEGAVVRLSSSVDVVIGPVVITELSASNRTSSSVSSFAWLAPDGTPCAATTPVDAIDVGGYHVRRLLVRQGQKLCGNSDFGSATLNWAGFRPY